jgi:DNA-binding response OmpR family regulator
MTVAGSPRGGDTPPSVIVLEDDRTTAELISQVLTATNMVNPVEIFGTGGDAIARLERTLGTGAVPVLLVLDLSLPDITGLEVLRWVRSRAEFDPVAVVMLSASGDDEDIERAYEIGIDAYLVKPAGIHGLPAVVAGLGLPHVLLPKAR